MAAAAVMAMGIAVVAVMGATVRGHAVPVVVPVVTTIAIPAMVGVVVAAAAVADVPPVVTAPVAVVVGPVVGVVVTDEVVVAVAGQEDAAVPVGAPPVGVGTLQDTPAAVAPGQRVGIPVPAVVAVAVVVRVADVVGGAIVHIEQMVIVVRVIVVPHHGDAAAVVVHDPDLGFARGAVMADGDVVREAALHERGGRCGQRKSEQLVGVHQRELRERGYQDSPGTGDEMGMSFIHPEPRRAEDRPRSRTSATTGARVRYVRALVLLLLILVSGCRRQGAGVPGVIRFDDEGAAVLALDGVEILPLRGALAEELALLPGAFVRVHGPRSGAGVRVRSYRLLDAGDGLVPVVGELVEHQGGLWIAEPGGAAYALRGEALVRLLPMVGARVWVSGAVMDGRHFLVHRYGLLRAPPAQEGATP